MQILFIDKKINVYGLRLVLIAIFILNLFNFLTLLQISFSYYKNM